MSDAVCAVDLGTSNIKAALVDDTGRILALVRTAVPHESSDFEFDPDGHADTLYRLIGELLAGRNHRVAAVSISSQRATVVPIAPDGTPARPAISWQDNRCSSAIGRFAERIGPDRFRRITGLPPSTLWSIAKILWLRENRPDTFRSVSHFALLHDYVMLKLGSEGIVADISNGSLSGMLDLRSSKWSSEVLDLSGIPESKLPRLVRPGELIGAVNADAARATGLPEGTPLVAGGGDQQCAALGVGVVDPGSCGVCLGTVAVISCPVSEPADSGGGFFCTSHVVPHRWVVEGILNSHGSALRWVRALLGADKAGDLDSLAEGSPPGARGVLFLPFLAGIGSPDFDAGTMGALAGLSLSSAPADIARAALEGVALEIARILDALRPVVSIDRLTASGGGMAHRLSNQILADLVGKDVSVCSAVESSLLGAAILAWTGVGRFVDPAEGARAWPCAEGEIVRPSLAQSHRDEIYNRYTSWVDAVKNADSRNHGCLLGG